MLSCRLLTSHDLVLRHLKTSYVISSCCCSSNSSKSQVATVKSKSEVAVGESKTQIVPNQEPGNDLPAELERDNRLMVKKSFFRVENLFPTTWIVNFTRAKRNFFYPPAAVVFKKDGISRAEYTICYRAEFSRLYVAAGSVATSLAIIGVFVKLYMYYMYPPSSYPDYDPYDFDSSFGALALFVAGMAYYIIAWRYIVKAKPVRMYYSKTKQQFTVVWFHPFNPKWMVKTTVKPGSAKVQKSFFYNSNLGGKKCWIGPDNFSFSTYFNVLYGYQKPKDIEALLDTNQTADNFFRQKKKGINSNIWTVH